MIASPNDKKRIHDYRIITASDALYLATLISDYLKIGWLLYGFPYGDDHQHYQAMIKYEVSNDS